MAQEFITVDFVESIYVLFSELEPFKQYDLPMSWDVEFLISAEDESCYGDYVPDPDTITIYLPHCKTAYDVVHTVIHEMIHMCVYMKDPHSDEYANHGAEFKKIKHAVCKQFGFAKEDI